MSARVIVDVLVTGTRIVGRAFFEAYKQAAANAAARKAAASGKGGGAGGDPLTRRTGMTLDEAHKILNVQADMEMAEIVKKYEHLFKMNDPKAGSTLYLQSKVARAKERIDLEMALHARKAEGSEQ
ncbi:Pam16-domain-containing protein [Syncephalis plumigaleata]|nr:Pam16-domain-containing protein [Syncephalis plumigaleata]